MEAVAGKFFGGHVVPDVARSCGLGQQIPDKVAEQSMRTSDVLTAVQEGRELRIAVPVGLVRDQRVTFQHRFEALANVACLIPDFAEILEVTPDLPFVPGEQDCSDIGEILVQRRTSDARLLGDLRHRHRPQPVLGHQRRGARLVVAELGVASVASRTATRCASIVSFHSFGIAPAYPSGGSDVHVRDATAPIEIG